MGNIDSSFLSDENGYDDNPQGRFVINFISATDVPAMDFLSNSDPYLKAYLAEDKAQPEDDNVQLVRISDVVTTPRRVNCTAATWNSYRDFHINPPLTAKLVVELYDYTTEKVDKEPLGSVSIPVAALQDETVKTFDFEFHKVGNPKKNPHFAVTLRRCFKDSPAPIQKTFFLIRHGESKWNKAQANRNIGGLLDRDHALTPVGIEQAMNLNKIWKDFKEREENELQAQSSDSNDAHAAPVAVPDTRIRSRSVSSAEVPDPMSLGASPNPFPSFMETVPDIVAVKPAEPAQIPPTTSVGTGEENLLDLDDYPSTTASSSTLPPLPPSSTDPMTPAAPVVSHDDDPTLHSVLPSSSPQSPGYLLQAALAANSNSSMAGGRETAPSSMASTPTRDDALAHMGIAGSGGRQRSNSSSAKSTSGVEDGSATVSVEADQTPPLPVSHVLHRSGSVSMKTKSLTVGFSNLSIATEEVNAPAPRGLKQRSMSMKASPRVSGPPGSDFLFGDGKAAISFEDEGSGADSDEDEDEDDEDDDDEGETDEITEERRRTLERQSMRISSMYSHVTLNQIITRRQEFTRMFLNADYVYSSPLTRAIETAFVSLEGHPAIEKGLILYSIIREIKGLGGLDTVGIAYGEDIHRRVSQELEDKLSKHRAEELMVDSLFVNDADLPWWTGMSSSDSKADQKERILEFLSFARYCEAKYPIFVGHSLFFKLFYSRRISVMLAQNRPELAEQLKRYRLGNAAVLAVTVLFGGKHESDAQILDADLLFGGAFHTTPDASTRSIRRSSNAGNKSKNSNSILSSVSDRVASLTSALADQISGKEKDEDSSGGGGSHSGHHDKPAQKEKSGSFTVAAGFATTMKDELKHGFAALTKKVLGDL